MELEDFLKSLNNGSTSPPEVKQEEPELEDEPIEMEAPPTPTGLDVMGAQLAAAQKKNDEDALRIADFMGKDDSPVRRRRGKRSSSEDSDSKPLEESKGPLTTFGHSSRPRRSVNYASIERGEEAQSQSLVTDFGTKKRQKRTRDELDENYTEEKPTYHQNRKNQRFTYPKTSSSKFVASTATQQNPDFANMQKLECFKNGVPNFDDPHPAADMRIVGTTLEMNEAIQRGSGGFRRFIGRLTDDQVFKIMSTVEKLCIVSEAEDKRLLQSLRHVYNSLAFNHRRDWEYAARMDTFDSRAFTGNMAMPMSEIHVKDNTVEKPRCSGSAVRLNCCETEPFVSNMVQTAEHFLSQHDVVHLFGCDICLKVFASRYELTKHECKEFNDYMCELTFKQQTLTLQAAYMYLCCSQCGLWLSVKTGEKGSKGWVYFATAMMNHSCRGLAPVIVYFRKSLPDDGKNVRLQIQMMSSSDVGLPIACADCEIDEFASLKECDEHFKEHHPTTVKQCTKCERSFGTDFLFRHHMQSHLSHSAQFANWITYTATFQPPPESGRHPHVGFNSEIPAIGGCTAGELEALEALENRKSEFVEPDTLTLRKKVFRWKRKKTKKENRSSPGSSTDSQFSYESGESSGEEQFQQRLKEAENESSSSSSCDSDSSDDQTTSKRAKLEKEKKVNGWLGYEHIDRTEMFEKSEEEVEARRLLDRLMDRRCFLAREKLLDPQEALEVLKNSESVELQHQTSSLANEILAATIRTVVLPASNCIDPLKDHLLVNKIFSYCPKCRLVFTTTAAVHSTTCDVAEDEIVVVHHAAAGPHAGIRCIFPDCKTHLCSVIALRSHCQMVHNAEVIIETPPATDPASDEFQQTRYDRSMLFLARHFGAALQDERTFQARMTDIDCFLPFNGRLEGKVILAPQNSRYPVPQNQLRHIPQPAPQRQLAPYQMNGAAAANRQIVRPIGLRAIVTVKPYKVPRTSRWFQCYWCSNDFESFDQFVDHLTRNHTHLCGTCGKAYSSANTKRTHVCQRMNQNSLDSRGAGDVGKTMTAMCGGCRERLPIETLFNHILRRHFSIVEYNQATGEVLPAPREVRVEGPPTMFPIRRMGNSDENGAMMTSSSSSSSSQAPPEVRMRQIKVSSGPVHGANLNQLAARDPPVGSFTLCPPDSKHLDGRLMCYLCELTFDNVRELGAHLEDHPEKWTNCPFCGHPTSSHHDLQRHLMATHVIRMNGRTCCAFCHENHPRFMASHMLFRCKRIAKCSICGSKSADPSANRIHMQRCHALALKRFQCAFCPMTFTSVGEYYEHHCTGFQSRLFSCSCQPDKYFSSVNQFCDHYDCVHVFRTKCAICQFDAQTLEALARHRTTHMKSHQINTPPLKLFILIRSFFPKPDSGYMRWVEGGIPPPSYIPVDRSTSTQLMGSLGGQMPSILRNAPPPKKTPRTLLEALESTFAVEKAADPVEDVADDDVIMLSDDENDDVLLEPTPSRNPSQIDREVRVERTEAGYGGKQQPGYVIDDANEMEVSEKASSGEPLVKEVVDENGDDELAVVAEVENASGTLSTNVSAGRSKSFKCSQCSQSFYTNRALQQHAESHRQDAGANVCTETYGIPKQCEAYLCRNCCVAFQSLDKFKKHMSIHGDTAHTCTQCSGIAFNQATIHNHMNAHTSKQVSYACGTCLFKFHSDLALMDHLYVAHSVPLFYFCKLCGQGSTEPTTVAQHVALHQHRYTLSQRFGACPATLLNYDPADEVEFRAKILEKRIQLHQPSDCAHRSLLLQNETVVACKTCFCTQGWFNYMAYNKFTEETGFPTFQQMPVPTDSRREFALFRHVKPQIGNVLINNGPTRGTTTTGAQITRPVIEPRRKVAPGWINSPVVSVTANGARVIRPSTTSSSSPPSTSSSSTSSNGVAHRRIVVQQRTGVPTVTGKPHVPITTKCDTCQQTLTTEFDRQLHTMHTSEATWFCRLCGFTQQSEIDLFVHYMKQHLTAAVRKFSGTGFKSCIYEMKCPISSCKSLAFKSVTAFQTHMRREHEALLPFESSTCNSRFSTQEQCEQHEAEHNEYLETNGTDGTCCGICGTLDVWSFPKDPVTDCLQSHGTRHGLDYRSSCKACLKQFPADTNQSQVVAHLRSAHSQPGADESTICHLCPDSIEMDDMEYVDHCKKHHVFNILAKSSCSTRGELVVSAGAEYENFVGLKVPALPTLTPKAPPPTTTKTLMTIAEAIGEVATTSSEASASDDVLTLE